MAQRLCVWGGVGGGERVCLCVKLWRSTERPNRLGLARASLHARLLVSLGVQSLTRC